MVTIKAGDVIEASGVRTGDSQNGHWLLCKVKAEKGRGSITIWNHDESFACADGDTIRIVKINSVSHNNRKYQDKWYEETNADCELECVEQKGNEYADDFPESAGDLPY